MWNWFWIFTHERRWKSVGWLYFTSTLKILSKTFHACSIAFSWSFCSWKVLSNINQNVCSSSLRLTRFDTNWWTQQPFLLLLVNCRHRKSIQHRSIIIIKQSKSVCCKSSGKKSQRIEVYPMKETYTHRKLCNFSIICNNSNNNNWVSVEWGLNNCNSW